MPAERRCAKCGASLAPFGAEALCPKCMLHEALGLEVDLTAQRATQFLKDMLKGVGPSFALGRDTTMLREILDKTAEGVGKDLKDQPDLSPEPVL
jgi:hypothetical protein